MANNKGNRVLCLGKIGLIIVPRKFDVLERKRSFEGKYASFMNIKFSSGNSADSSLTEALSTLDIILRYTTEPPKGVYLVNKQSTYVSNDFVPLQNRRKFFRTPLWLNKYLAFRLVSTF